MGRMNLTEEESNINSLKSLVSMLKTQSDKHIAALGKCFVQNGLIINSTLTD